MAVAVDPPRSCPSQGEKADDGNGADKKRPLGSPAPQKGAKIRFGKAYEASYTFDEDVEGEQQHQQEHEYEQEEQEGEQGWN